MKRCWYVGEVKRPNAGNLFNAIYLVNNEPVEADVTPTHSRDLAQKLVDKLNAKEVDVPVELFNVVQFFQDDSYEYVRRNVPAEESVKAARHYTSSVGARMGMVKKVIITDSGDCTVFVWEYGKGVTFPPESAGRV